MFVGRTQLPTFWAVGSENILFELYNIDYLDNINVFINLYKKVHVTTKHTSINKKLELFWTYLLSALKLPHKKLIWHS